MRADGALLPVLRRCFEVHLKAELGLSRNTVQSYRDTWRMLLRYFTETLGLGRAEDLRLQDVTRQRVLDFLQHLEAVRHVSARTRNQRLAAVRAFARFVCGEEPRLAPHFTRILRIPDKRYRRTIIDYLEPDELHCLLSQVRLSTEHALRDFALLVYAYNTGARAQEIAETDLSWLLLDNPPHQVRIWGKGGRQRVVPLWPATVQLLQRYLQDGRKRPTADSEARLFISRTGRSLTRYGVSRLFRRYLQRACGQMPSLKKKRLSVHSMRHTTAVHLLQNGCELNVIKAWLGHVSLQSTDVYTETNLETKRNVLEKFVTPHYVTSFLDPSGTTTESSLEWLDRI